MSCMNKNNKKKVNYSRDSKTVTFVVLLKTEKNLKKLKTSLNR